MNVHNVTICHSIIGTVSLSKEVEFEKNHSCIAFLQQNGKSPPPVGADSTVIAFSLDVTGWFVSWVFQSSRWYGVIFGSGSYQVVSNVSASFVSYCWLFGKDFF